MLHIDSAAPLSLPLLLKSNHACHLEATTHWLQYRHHFFENTSAVSNFLTLPPSISPPALPDAPPAGRLAGYTQAARLPACCNA